MKRTALLVALLALPGCLTECGAIGHGVIGRGAVSDGAVGGGAVGGRPSSGATACAAPGAGSTLEALYDADQPGAGDVPTDVSGQGLGDMAEGVTAPTYGATDGPDGLAAWSGTGGASEHYRESSLTAFGPPYTIWCIAKNTENAAADRVPCAARTGPRHYATNAIRTDSGGGAAGVPLISVSDESQWAIYSLTITTGNDTLAFLNDAEQVSGVGATSELDSGTTVTLSGSNSTSPWVGKVSVVGLNSAAVSADDLRTYAACKYPGTFTAP